MSNFVVVYDACVLHPPSLRDLLIRLAQTDLYRARWTDEIHDEWIRSAIKRAEEKGRPLDSARLARTREKMNSAVPECLVTGYKGLADHIELPDPGDRHVLAAAIKCEAGAIVTYNLKDFPAEIMPKGMSAQHPDEFITHLYDLSPSDVRAAVKAHRDSLQNPSWTIDELFTVYLRHQLAGTVECLRQDRALL